MASIHFVPIADNPSWGLCGPSDEVPRPAQFIHHTGRSRFRPQRDIDMSQMDTFAEYLSDGLTVTQAAQKMGRDYAYGNAMLQRIRTRLGPQAI